MQLTNASTSIIEVDICGDAFKKKPCGKINCYQNNVLWASCPYVMASGCITSIFTSLIQKMNWLTHSEMKVPQKNNITPIPYIHIAHITSNGVAQLPSTANLAGITRNVQSHIHDEHTRLTIQHAQNFIYVEKWINNDHVS